MRSVSRTTSTGRILALLATFALSAPLAGRPETVFDGICYSPYHNAAYGIAGEVPDSVIRADLAELRGRCKRILTYGTLPWSWGKIPRLCVEYGIECYPGAYICDNASWNRENIEAIVGIAKAGYSTTKGVIIGNEVLLQRQQSESQLVSYVDEVRSRIPANISVGYADSWTVWLGQGGYAAPTTLAAHCDFILVHVYGFWDDKMAAQSADYALSRYNEVRARYPGKTVIIGESGWPTAGSSRGVASPGVHEQNVFLSSFRQLATNSSIPSFIFEAYDQPTACKPPGPYGVENYWGVMNWIKSTNLGVSVASPTNALVFLGLNTAQSFSIATTGGIAPSVAYTWKVDDAVQATETGVRTSALNFQASPELLGPHSIRVEITDLRNTPISREWVLVVGEGDPDLLLYWPFDADGRDQSGWGNNITIEGDANIIRDGVKGASLEFNPAP